MDKFNLVFIETSFSRRSLLGRTLADFMLRSLYDFHARDSHIVKEEAYIDNKSDYISKDAINIVLTLDRPLVRRQTLEHYVALLKHKNIGFARLGSKGSEAFICIGDASDDGIFVNDEDFLRIADAKSYNMVYNLLRDRLLDERLTAGVFIPDKTTVFIDDTVKIEAGAQILPFSRIEGNSVVKEGAKVCASYLKNTVVENGVSIEYSHAVDTLIGAHATVGPFARLRSAQIGPNCRVGDFVEVKASRLGAGVKSAHLSYVGDADVGDGTNVGCGTVFCNYDGHEKHRTTVGSDCFIGANTNLIAPVVVGDNAYIAAGTTVTRDVGEKSFTIGRVRQDTKTKNKT